MKKVIKLKFYSNGHLLPSYTKYYEYDLNDDESYMKAFMECGAYAHRVCDANPEITIRIESIDL